MSQNIKRPTQKEQTVTALVKIELAVSMAYDTGIPNNRTLRQHAIENFKAHPGLNEPDNFAIQIISIKDS